MCELFSERDQQENSEKMTKKIVKLTPSMLKRIIKEEAAKLREETAETVVVADGKPATAEEVDADELADTQAQHIDFIKALKIKESKLLKQLKLVQEQKAKAIKKALASI